VFAARGAAVSESMPPVLEPTEAPGLRDALLAVALPAWLKPAQPEQLVSAVQLELRVSEEQ